MKAPLWRCAGLVRRVWLPVLLIASSGGAAADWSPVGGDEEIFRAYADPDTIRRSGDRARMAGLYDFKRADRTPEGRELFSTTVQREYDCASLQVRLLAHVDHAGHMGEGAAVSSGAAPGRWEPVVAGALDEAFLKIACGPR